jgi:NAD(P)-dependent dehydrogenase (short-subunit alcohol dehydrogenase family)
VSSGELKGQLAIVIGAGRGIGRACAIALSRQGADVMLVARTGPELESAAASIRQGGGVAHVAVADATDETNVTEIIERSQALGDARVMVTAAGTNRPGPARDYALPDWDHLFALNVRATFVACQAMGRSLLDRGVPGSIVTLSSQMGSVGYPDRVAYCSTKHAVEGMTKALAVEWAPSRIRVNAVAPTFVETPMTAPFLAEPEFRSEVLDHRLPTGRFATVEEVAAAVVFLAGDAAPSITGHVLKVDGGWTAW